MLPLGLIQVFPPATLFRIGPVAIDFYGLGYALALAVGVAIASRQALLRHEDPDHIGNAIIFVFVLGLIGARLYHLIDQWNNLYAQDPIKAILPPYTGLGIYGGIAGGVIAVLIYTRRHRLSFARWADIAVPGVLLGQAIARWGNFFNQELYGPPTNLPWGITIDAAHRVAQYPVDRFPELTTGFHPLFFYESALDFAGALVALWLSRRLAGRLRDGDLFSFWFIWYGGVRSVLETFRIGYDWTFFGIPTAILVGIAAVALGVLTIAWRHRRPGRSTAEVDRERASEAAAGPGEAAAGEPPEPGRAIPGEDPAAAGRRGEPPDELRGGTDRA